MKKTTCRIIMAVTMVIVLIAGISLAEREPWDCPQCGRKGNTRNFCGGCGHPAPPLESNTSHMMHAEYISAELDTEVIIESYVQDHQLWWDNKVSVYLQSKDGAYFAYNMACSKEDAANLITGTKIRVRGYKSEWAGEVEIVDGIFEFIAAEPWVAEPTDVTELLASEELINHMNEFVTVKGATVAAQKDGASIAYKNPVAKTDDLYFSIDVNGKIYSSCVDFFLRGKDSDVYKAVEGLKVGDVVDLEGFLYWYNGPYLQVTSVAMSNHT